MRLRVEVTNFPVETLRMELALKVVHINSVNMAMGSIRMVWVASDGLCLQSLK